MPEFDIIAAVTSARSRAVGAQSILNFYAERTPEGKTVLYSTPGLLEWLQVGTGPIRGMKVSGSSLFVVSGESAYVVNGQGTVTALGAVAGTGLVSMAENGVQVMIVTGNKGYIVTVATNTLAQITDPDFPGASIVDFVDGFFVFTEPTSARFWSTDSYNGASLGGLSFATAEYQPDQLVSLLVDHREIWLFGERTIEVWFNAGNAGFPFERINGAVIDQGCAAPFSVAHADNQVFWLGNDANGRGIVWSAAGYSPVRISTHELEDKISGYGNVANAEAWTYQQNGHTFYVLSFPTQDITWVYDIATQMWSQRACYSSSDQALHRHLGRCHVNFGGLNIVGDSATNQLHSLSLDQYTDNGELIFREITAPHIRSGGGRGFYAGLEVRMESGIGLTLGQGNDPQIMLQTSDDGGRTWGSEQWRAMGKIGEYFVRANWRRLGSAFVRTFRLRVTDPVPVTLISAVLEYSE